MDSRVFKKIRLALTTALVIVLLTMGAEAAQQEIVTRGGGQEVKFSFDYRALVVGISNYTNGWPKLPNAAKDAKEVAAALKKVGFKVDLLLDPTSEQLNEALSGFVFETGAEENRALLFFFAGHGETLDLTDGTALGYIVPKDCPVQDQDLAGFYDSAISMRRIEDFVLAARSRHMFMVFDSCFSGSIFTMLRNPPKGITTKTSRPVRQFLTAGDKGETVPDKSVFKEVFLQSLRGEADLNRDGYVTASELGLFLPDRVVNYSKKTQHPQFGTIQNRALAQGDFVFVLPKKDTRTASVAPTKPGPGRRAVGRIKITANVDGAKFNLGGRWLSTRKNRAILIESVPEGEYEIVIRKEGYQDWIGIVDILAGETVDLPVSMVRADDQKVPSQTVDQTRPDATDESAPPVHPGDKQPQKQEVSPQVRIEKLLALAEEDIQANRLTSPSPNNALERYLDILLIDPDNKAAQEGLSRIKDRYLVLANDRVEQGDFATALKYLDRALKVAPGNAEVLALKERIKVQEEEHRVVPADPDKLARMAFMAAKMRFKAGDAYMASVYLKRAKTKLGGSAEYRALESEISSSLSRATEALQSLLGVEDALREGDLGRARELLAQAEADLPGDRRVADFRRRIDQAEGDRYITQARLQIKSDDWDQARQSLALATELVPGDARLQPLADELDQLQAEAKALADAERQRQAEERRQRGLQLLAQADAAVKSRDAARAKRFIDEAAGLIPGDNRLASLRSTVEEKLRYHPRTGGSSFSNSLNIRFVKIMAGSFKMGNDLGFNIPENEQPRHPVRISKPFYMGVYEVTKGDWIRIMGERSKRTKGDRREPITDITWEETQEFIRRLNDLEWATYRLPTEAEWEYACKAGTMTDWYFGDDPTKLGNYGWYLGNSGFRVRRVGQKRPNRWGLYDMHGNVAEWCADYYHPTYYHRSPGSDPKGPSQGKERVIRGGSWLHAYGAQRSANRLPGRKGGTVGFRLVREM